MYEKTNYMRERKTLNYLYHSFFWGGGGETRGRDTRDKISFLLEQSSPNTE